MVVESGGGGKHVQRCVEVLCGVVSGFDVGCSHFSDEFCDREELLGDLYTHLGIPLPMRAFLSCAE